MNNHVIKKAILGVMVTGLLSACGGSSKSFDDPVQDESYSSGDLDLSRYVALGDSLTAGYKDGTLYLDGQLDSFPNTLAGLFAEADGGEFTQPLVEDNLGGLLFNGTETPEFDTRLVLDNIGGELITDRQSGDRIIDMFTPLSGGPYNNMGVPGAKSFHLLGEGYGNINNFPATANPWAVYLNIADGSNSILTESLSLPPTFFSLWIGNNDILGYATSGGDETLDSITPAMDADDCQTTVDFQSCYSFITGALLSSGAKGVLINIPSIVDIPFFTTVPFNSIPLDAETAAGVTANYNATYNAGLAAAVAGSLITQEEADQRTIAFTAGQNAIVITDESLKPITGLPSIRQATADDYILLTTAPLLGGLRDSNLDTSIIGVGSALLDSEVLTAAEAMEIEMAREAYNSVIEGLAADSPNLAMYDVAALLADLNDGDGVSYGLGTVDGTFATGGAFSLDGVHPTARGYAIIANDIIDTINAEFNANLPKANPGEFSETFFAFPDGFDFSP